LPASTVKNMRCGWRNNPSPVKRSSEWASESCPNIQLFTPTSTNGQVGFF